MSDFMGVIVEEPDELFADRGKRKVTTWRSSPLGPNDTLQLWMGDQELDFIELDQSGLFIHGYVPEIPDDDDTLHFQFPGEEKTDTELKAADGIDNS